MGFQNKAILIRIFITKRLAAKQAKLFVIIFLCKIEQIIAALYALSFLIGIFYILRLYIVKVIVF